MNLHSHNNPFLTEKMVKNGYYRNEGFGLAWDRIKVRQIGPFTTTPFMMYFQSAFAVLVLRN